MTVAEVVATGLLALLLGFVGMIVYATMRQLHGEARAAASRRDAGPPG
jgi:preprotein translocase subunit Sss1